MKRILIVLGGLLSISWQLSAQTTITGTVTGADVGESLPGVNVTVVGTNQGAVTGIDGQYSLQASPTDQLRFSFVGYNEEVVTVGNRTTINVELYPDLEQLSEVVVVGYGTQLKDEVTGNIARVSGEAIENVPVPSVEQALQGRAAGVQVTSLNGKVGQGINIRVRGSASINANNEPLYVIDGIPVTTDNFSTTSAPINPLADINFNDIASIEILKDAYATAIYGSRGSNGVVLITTKQGKAGKTKITANYQTGFSNPAGKREFLNAAQYVELYQEAAWNLDVYDGYFGDILEPNNPTTIPTNIESHPDYPGSELEGIRETFDFLAGDTDWRSLETNTDWQEQAFQDARLNIFDLSASGGNEKTQFYLSGGYSDQDGILIGNRFERISGRMNISHELSSKFDINANLSVARSKNYRVTEDDEFSTPMQLVAQAPITPVRDKQGNLFDDALNPAMFYYPATVELENSSFTTTTFRNIGNASLTFKPIEGLKIIGDVALDLLTQQDNRYQNDQTEAGRSPEVNGVAEVGWLRAVNTNTKLYGNYVRQFFSKHTLDFTLGTEYQAKQIDASILQGNNFPTNSLPNLSSAAVITAGNETFRENYIIGYFARANINLSSRYIIGLSARQDYSSRFGRDVQSGFFPAVSAAWLVSEEEFFTNNTFNLLKVRASYGQTGNSGIGDYAALGLYTATPYNERPSLVPNQIANPDLTWETTTQADVGVELGVWNNRLTAEFAVYHKLTSDLLLNVPVPLTTGYSSQFANVGELVNQGIEAAANFSLIAQEGFEWKIGGNWAFNDNEVTRLNGNQELIPSTSSRWINVIKVGEPLGAFYAPEYAGVNPANGDALWYVNGPVREDEVDGIDIVEQNGRYATSVYSWANNVILGSPIPTVSYGFNTDFRFSNFDVSVLFQGVSGNKIFNGAGGFMSANGRFEDNQTVDQLNRWQRPGDITDVPRASYLVRNGTQPSSRYLQDGDYLRLKTVTLGYNFTGETLSRFGMSRLRLYVVGQNLLTFTDYDGWDPEVNTDYVASNVSLGNDFYAAPQARTFTFGIKAEF
jgi:TonB-linked SusC/RagA family outer membrane protein